MPECKSQRHPIRDVAGLSRDDYRCSEEKIARSCHGIETYLVDRSIDSARELTVSVVLN